MQTMPTSEREVEEKKRGSLERGWRNETDERKRRRRNLKSDGIEIFRYMPD